MHGSHDLAYPLMKNLMCMSTGYPYPVPLSCRRFIPALIASICCMNNILFWRHSSFGDFRSIILNHAHSGFGFSPDRPSIRVRLGQLALDPWNRRTKELENNEMVSELLPTHFMAGNEVTKQGLRFQILDPNPNFGFEIAVHRQ